MFDPVTTTEHRRELVALRAADLRHASRAARPGRFQRATGAALVRIGLRLTAGGHSPPPATRTSAHDEAPAPAGASS